MMAWSMIENPDTYATARGGDIQLYAQQQIQWGAEYLMHIASGTAGGNIEYLVDFIGNPSNEVGNPWYRIDTPASFWPSGLGSTGGLAAHTVASGVQVYADAAAGLAAASIALQGADNVNFTAYQSMAITLYSKATSDEGDGIKYQLNATRGLIPQLSNDK